MLGVVHILNITPGGYITGSIAYYCAARKIALAGFTAADEGRPRHLASQSGGWLLPPALLLASPFDGPQRTIADYDAHTSPLTSE